MNANTNSNSYVMLFAVAMCVVVSTILALLANGLKPMQQAAKEFDRQKNVMRAAGLIEAGDRRSREQLEKLFDARIEEMVVDTETGEQVADEKDAQELMREDPKRYRSVAVAEDEQGNTTAYILPVSGKGLWSTIKGYIALESDKNTVMGVTFYEHGETPGLGGEVENPEWTAQWVGKSIRDDDGDLVSVTVKKGKVDLSIPEQKQHYVDGLSGATITSNGVTKFVKSDLETFAAYLKKH